MSVNQMFSLMSVTAIALVPTNLASSEKSSNTFFDTTSKELASNTKLVQTVLCFGLALTTIAFTSACLSDENNSVIQYTCETGVTLGLGLTAIAAKRLYDTSSFR